MNIIVNLNKDRGITSQDAVTAVKRLFKVRKAGHTGTLDPLATGVLLVCLNEATKIAGLIEAMGKEYVAVAELGRSTDTYDSEGRVVRSADPSGITADGVRAALEAFVGEIRQVPPMYSALKVGGEPLYKLARKGLEVEREARKVFVGTAELLAFDNPVLKLRIVCSKGVYIRSIVNDLGEALGVGAHMTGLVRTRVGAFRIEDSAPAGSLPDFPPALHSVDDALSHIPGLCVDPDSVRKARNGNPVQLAAAEEFRAGSLVRLKDRDGRLFGIGKVAGDSIKIKRLLFL
jgi:tRNA pseudouridine55 synthase